MQHQRKEAASGPADTDAPDWDAQAVLSERVSTLLRGLHLSPESFLLAGIGGFLARLQNQPSVTLSYGEQQIYLTMDAALPFRDLVEQVDSQLAETTTRNGSSSLRNGSAPVDASLQRLTPAHLLESAPAQNAPLEFVARMADNSWNLAVTAPGQPQSTIERILSYLATFLDAAAGDLDHAAGTLLLTSETAALDLYRDFNQTAIPFPNASVIDLFSEKLVAYGSNAAVKFGDSALTYAQLDAESTNLARIFQVRGADQAHPVAVCIERSEKMPVVLLATLKAGSYFVPLDPSHPRQRLLDMLEECKPAVVIVSSQTQGLFDGPDLPLSGLPLFVPPFDTATASPVTLPSISARDKAYMIYTSGTTGRPKGVMIPHGALTNFLLAMRECPGLGAGDHLLAVATLSFDMSILDMFLPLVSGATIVIASERAARDPWELAKIFETQGITCMQATPVTWRMLLSSGYKGTPDLKVLIGGEALSRDLANELGLISGEIWNCYGPTETTVYSSVLRIEPGSGPVPIGPPMANTVFYVTDPAGNLLPPEIAGELSIGGAGVALGYFQRPELNRDRFIADPWTQSNEFTTQPMLFRTGDQVRLTANGEQAFEFFGRLDHQVKLRGYRIELGEIEVVLRTHPAVADAAVLLREDEPGEPWLVAYVTPQRPEASLEPKELLDFAASSLPVYMLPSRIVSLPALPLTGSGKVDKRALGGLPAPSEAGSSTEQASGAGSYNDQPLDALETSLLRIFRDTLRLKSFAADDNFFEHGGYSMLAIRLFAKIGTVLHKQLPITALFDAPTVRKLADLIRRGDPLQALVPIREHGTEAPFFLVHSYLLYGAAKTIVESDRPVYGLRERSATAAPLDLQRCVSDYSAAIQRAWPKGIVHLGGWCAAATLTIELARRLTDEGRQVGMVALFDAEAPGFVALPQSGSPLLARLRAMRTFHLGRMRSLSWSGRLLYFNERLTQAPLNLIERFYLKHHARIERWQRSMRWLPSVFFYNRFTQIGHLQTDHIEQLDTRIQLFRARDVTVVAGSDEELGWGAIARRGVEVSFIPGHHESMFLDPNVEVLRDEFQSSMRSVENELAVQEHSRRD